MSLLHCLSLFFLLISHHSLLQFFFPSFFTDSRQRPMMAGQCTRSISTLDLVKTWNISITQPSLCSVLLLLWFFYHPFVILPLSICHNSQFCPHLYTFLLFSLPSAPFSSLIATIFFLLCFASPLLSLSSHASLPSPVLFLPPRLGSPRLFLSLSSALPLPVMEVSFYKKWQSKELYKGYSGFLYDTAILLITLRHTCTHILSLGTLLHPGTPFLFIFLLPHTHTKKVHLHTTPPGHIKI